MPLRVSWGVKLTADDLFGMIVDCMSEDEIEDVDNPTDGEFRVALKKYLNSKSPGLGHEVILLHSEPIVDFAVMVDMVVRTRPDYNPRNVTPPPAFRRLMESCPDTCVPGIFTMIDGDTKSLRFIDYPLTTPKAANRAC